MLSATRRKKNSRTATVLNGPFSLTVKQKTLADLQKEGISPAKWDPGNVFFFFLFSFLANLILNQWLGEVKHKRDVLWRVRILGGVDEWTCFHCSGWHNYILSTKDNGWRQNDQPRLDVFLTIDVQVKMIRTLRGARFLRRVAFVCVNYSNNKIYLRANFFKLQKKKRIFVYQIAIKRFEDLRGELFKLQSKNIHLWVKKKVWLKMY